MAIGDGCLKPLNRTYGAYQYHPHEVKSIALFFVLYYFVYNCGSITSRLVSPILRQDVRCFGNDDCFTIAFAIPGICMILVALLTIIANRYSVTVQADGTTLLNVFACIWVNIKIIKKFTTINIKMCLILACNRHENQIKIISKYTGKTALA